MANEGDLGNDAAQRNLDAALLQHKLIKQSYSEYCIGCDERISDARQEATGGCDRCVPCLELEAVRRRHFR